MQIWPRFAASHLYPSDTARERPMRAEMGGLRHNSRHKIPGWLPRGFRVVQKRGQPVAGDAFQPVRALSSFFIFLRGHKFSTPP
jgi:hypothetical protein